MSLIKKGLYIGNFRDAQDLHFLQRNGISHVLCSAGELYPVYPQKFVYKHVQANDIPSYNLSRHFDHAADFIHEAIQSGGNILVHCAAGISRSVSLALAYFIKHEGLKLANAYNMVKNKRFIANPNPGFMRQLRDYERKVETNRVRQEPEPKNQFGTSSYGKATFGQLDNDNGMRITPTQTVSRIVPSNGGGYGEINNQTKSVGRIQSQHGDFRIRAGQNTNMDTQMFASRFTPESYIDPKLDIVKNSSTLPLPTKPTTQPLNSKLESSFKPNPFPKPTPPNAGTQFTINRREAKPAPFVDLPNRPPLLINGQNTFGEKNQFQQDGGSQAYPRAKSTTLAAPQDSKFAEFQPPRIAVHNPKGQMHPNFKTMSNFKNPAGKPSNPEAYLAANMKNGNNFNQMQPFKRTTQRAFYY